MPEKKLSVDRKKVDTKEFEIPETVFIRDIENRVLQGIVVQVLSEIDGIGLVEGNFIDSIFNRGQESIAGIYAEQESKSQTVNIKIEINVLYGVSIPEKAEQIQIVVSEEITKITGLHVACVHVVFKNVLPIDQIKMPKSPIPPPGNAALLGSTIAEEYNDEF